MRQYHFSYDTINYKRDFKDYDEAKRYLLCVLANTKITAIEAINESTFILSYYIKDNDPLKLCNYLNTNLSKYFYFTISLIAKNQLEKYYYKFSNVNKDLDTNFKKEWQNLTCENFKKPITEY